MSAKRRIQSSSSINLYKQCPRKYYYKYIQKIPEPPSIHCVRGNIVHSALEHFFNIHPDTIKDLEKDLKQKMDSLLDKHWFESKEKLRELKMPMDELNEFYVDSRDMLNNWLKRYLKNLNVLINQGKSLKESFLELKPKAEEYFIDEELGVQGYVDAIYILPDNKIKVVDYKTSRKDHITPEYALQAGIYAVLIQKIKGELPKVVSFDFLKGEMKDVIVDEDLVKNTLFEIEQIHESTSSDNIVEYSKKPSGLCSWCNERGSGKCAYFELCKPND